MELIKKLKEKLALRAIVTRKATMRRLVIKEATKLRDMITPNEADRLKFGWLDSRQATKCIYGQLTGGCFSVRATDLIKACASRVYKNDSGNKDLRDSKLNGSPIKGDRRDFWSPIEVFISQNVNKYSDNNERLVQFIKKEIDELIFEN